MVDAGVTEVAAVGRLLELGAARVVIGTETLAGPAPQSSGCGGAAGRRSAGAWTSAQAASSRRRGLGRLGAAEALARLGPTCGR